MKYVGIIALVLFSCNAEKSRLETALAEAGENRIELEKTLEYFEATGDPTKWKAACYVIENLPGQYHYRGTLIDRYRHTFSKMDSISSVVEVNYYRTWDSLQQTIDPKGSMMEKVYDIKVIKSAYLIKDIEAAFVAWNYPWTQGLGFDEFAKYLLPYKLRNELPEDWRTELQKRYHWLLDSMKQTDDIRKACVFINNDLKKWLYVTRLSCPFNLAYSDLMKLRSGRCAETTQLTAYAMRAMGIPVTLDYVAVWGNRNAGHDWNGLLEKGKFVPFLGAEVNPGVYKIQFQSIGSVKSKWPKVFRQTYAPDDHALYSGKNADIEIPDLFLDNRFEDVTKEYALSFPVQLELDLERVSGPVCYLSVFNNRRWRPVYWGRVENDAVVFPDMGSDIVYLPAYLEDDDLVPVNMPFLLTKDGLKEFIKPDLRKLDTLKLERKYPADQSNRVAVGDTYELFYWDEKWKSLGKQMAEKKYLIYNNVPHGALLWLRDLDEGTQERIFIADNNKQVWY